MKNKNKDNIRREKEVLSKDIIMDYKQNRQDLRNKKGKFNHLGETPSMFSDTRTYLVYLDTRRLLRELVPHSKRPISDIIDDLMKLYYGDLESKVSIFIEKEKIIDIGFEELDLIWLGDKSLFSFTTDSNKILFGYYNSLGYCLPNDSISEYKKILSKLDIEDVDKENIEEEIDGTPSYDMVRKTISIYVPILKRMLIGKKDDYTWNEMIRQYKWQEYPLV